MTKKLFKLFIVQNKTNVTVMLYSLPVKGCVYKIWLLLEAAFFCLEMLRKTV